MVIVEGTLFSMISASNASILAESRVALSMSQLGHLPRGLGAVSEQTRTPIIALLLVGAGIGIFAMLLPLEELAHFADCVLLIALILVNASLIQHHHRHRQGQLTLCSIVPTKAQDELIQSENERLNRARERIEASTGFNSVETIIVRHQSVSDGILEASKDHDGLVVGASEQSFSNQIVFGSIPEEIARKSNKPVIVIKHYQKMKALFGRVMSE